MGKDITIAELEGKAGPEGEEARLSHNLHGQKLGRKGRVTRERIIAATCELLEESPDLSLSLSAVARRANVGMTSVYLYFSDLTELLLAVLEPVMEEAEQSYMALLREYWPDARLEECCLRFMQGAYAFGEKHARILHLRNAMADQYDDRMIVWRVRAAQPILALIARQLGLEDRPPSQEATALASVLMSGMERAMMVATDPLMPASMARVFGPRDKQVIEPLARILALSARDARAREKRRAEAE